MKRRISTVFVLFAIVFASNAVLADYVAESFTCKLKEGKTPKEIQVINSKWLKWVRENVNKDITSSVGTAAVGDQDMFLFVDTYPDLNTWAATQTALASDAASELKDIFEEVSHCSENRLWNFKPTK